ncbi:acyl carrier protein [Candidatus Omnitrophota bacterium]
MNEKLHEIISDIFELEADTIKDTLTANDIELWDSMNHLRLITAIEEEFGIKFTMAEIQSIDSIKILIDLCAKKSS